MKWVGISGSWRATSGEVERDVRDFVREVIQRGDGIVTGGALNVDYFALDEAMRHDKTAQRIKVFLPTTLTLYASHYRRRADEGVITSEQAEALIEQLTALKSSNPNALIEDTNHTEVNQDSYFERNSAVMKASDELAAFQVNKSEGTQDTINKAREQGKKVYLKEYLL